MLVFGRKSYLDYLENFKPKMKVVFRFCPSDFYSSELKIVEYGVEWRGFRYDRNTSNSLIRSRKVILYNIVS